MSTGASDKTELNIAHGSLLELKRSQGTRTLKIAAGRRSEHVAGLMEPVAVNGHFEYRIASGSEREAILRSFLDAQIPVERFDVALPTLNKIFIEEVRTGKLGAGRGDGGRSNSPVNTECWCS